MRYVHTITAIGQTVAVQAVLGSVAIKAEIAIFWFGKVVAIVAVNAINNV